MTNTKAPKAQPPSEPEPQAPSVVEPPESEVAEILTKHIRCTETGIIFEGEMPLDKWTKGYEFFSVLRSKTQWWRGDMLIYGEKHYGESYAQAVDVHGKSESRLQTYVYVCGRFPIERRRPEISFDHHAETASLDPREADRVLLEAIKLRWTKMDVRAEVAKINERNGVPKRIRKSSGTAAKVAASGKTPQDPLDPAALVWNGYPLSTKDRLVYQGPEVLDAQEADKAAHHHKFPHAEALVNWLEEHKFFRKEDEPCPATPLLTTPGSSGAPLSDPTVAPVPTPPAAPAPAQQAPEPAPVTLQPKAPETPPAPAQTPIEIAEGHILAFNIASLSVDWKAVPPMAAKRWLNTLLARADTIIDILQGEPVTPRK